jgi:hypothetical protein
MWFFLRMTFWLAVVLVLLPSGGSQTAPNLQISASEAFSAARGAVTDFEHFCDRQQEACVVGSRTAVTLGQRAQAGAKMLYEFLTERLGSDESESVRTRDSVPLPQPRPDKLTFCIHYHQPSGLPDLYGLTDYQRVWFET